MEIRNNATESRINASDWSEEQLRFRMLESIRTLAGDRCDKAVTADTLGTELGLHYEDVFRVLDFLRGAGYLVHLEGGARVCITPAGVHYLAEKAQRRRSVRSDPG